MEAVSYCSLLKRLNLQRQPIKEPLADHTVVCELRVSVNSLKSLEDPVLLDILDFLELISGQKPKIYRATDRYVGSTKKFFVSCGVHLSKKTLLNSLLYLSLCTFPSYVRRYGYVHRKLGLPYYVFCFKDFFVFPNFKGKPFSGNVLLKVSGQPSFLCDFLRYWRFPVYFNGYSD